MNTTAELINLARVTAQRHAIDEALFCALCEHESSWNTYAARYEPLFFKNYVAPLWTNGKVTITEAYLRATSWGLGQIMGQTARELGFDRGSIAELCDPTTGLEFAALKLARCLEREHGDVKQALLGYNGGKNAAYPALVMTLYGKYKTEAPAT